MGYILFLKKLMLLLLIDLLVCVKPKPEIKKNNATIEVASLFATANGKTDGNTKNRWEAMITS